MLHRKIADWEWYTDPNTFRVFIHLLLTANCEPGKWRGIALLPGQTITGRKGLATDLKLSEQEIRTSLNKLKNSKNISIESTNKYSIITVCKLGEYQSFKTAQQPTQQPAQQPTINQQSTTNNNITIKQDNKRGFSPPTIDDFKNYFQENGYPLQLAESAFKGYEVADWKDSKGNPVKNWKQKCHHVWFRPENNKLAKKENNNFQYALEKAI